MVYRSNEPYNDLPLLPPSAAIETAARAPTLHHRQPGAGRIEGCGESHPESVYPDQLDSPARGPVELGNREHRDHAGCAIQAAVQEPSRTDPRTRQVLRYRTASCGKASTPCKTDRSALI